MGRERESGNSSEDQKSSEVHDISVLSGRESKVERKSAFPELKGTGVGDRPLKGLEPGNLSKIDDVDPSELSAEDTAYFTTDPLSRPDADPVKRQAWLDEVAAIKKRGWAEEKHEALVREKIAWWKNDDLAAARKAHAEEVEEAGWQNAKAVAERTLPAREALRKIADIEANLGSATQEINDAEKSAKRSIENRVLEAASSKLNPGPFQALKKRLADILSQKILKRK